MFTVNEHFLNLSESYLFSTIAREVDQFRNEHPHADIIRMGIGDVTRPLPPAIIDAMTQAVADMGHADTFHGYGPEQGYEFLRKAIAEHDYRNRGIDIAENEIFVSDGAKSDTANILDILGTGNRVALTDPVYPVYLDSNIMAGRALGRDIVTLPCTSDDSFIPQLPAKPVDIIYLCYPNNPTGTTLTREQLGKFVDYALAHEALILFDSAYESFVTSDNVPHSIYEIPGARHCAIEFRSFSKTAGFTGIRCGYTVVPTTLHATTKDGSTVNLHSLWNRRQTTKFNGASYISQRGAAAIYSPEGNRQVRQIIEYYLRNAHALRQGLIDASLEVYGGIDAPYVWVKASDGLSSWDFFRQLLHSCHIVTTPGVGFGSCGEGYVRLTAFNTYENTLEAINRLKKLITK